MKSSRPVVSKYDGLTSDHPPHWTQIASCTLRPADLRPLPHAFDDDDFIFELKTDGFRALAWIRTQPGSSHAKETPYKSFLDLCAAIHLDLDCEAVLDDEIVVLDQPVGRNSMLLRHRGADVFYVFDVPWLNGQDLRSRV